MTPARVVCWCDDDGRPDPSDRGVLISDGAEGEVYWPDGHTDPVWLVRGVGWTEGRRVDEPCRRRVKVVSRNRDDVFDLVDRHERAVDPHIDDERGDP